MFSYKNILFFIGLLINSISFLYASPNYELINSLKKSAIEKSPKLNILKAKLEQSNYTKYTSLTYQLPNASFNLKRQKNFYESNSALLRSLNLNTPKYSWGIDYQWVFFNYGNLINTQRANAENSLNEINYDIALKEFDIDFNSYFLNYLLAKYKIATISNSIKKAETAKKEAKLGFELGQKTKIDTLRADANYISLSSKKINYEVEIQNSYSQLNQNTGINREQLLFIENLAEEDLYKLIDEIAKYSTINEKPNIELSILKDQLDKEIKINSIDAKKLTQIEWPELKIQGSYDNSADRISQTLHQPSRSHSIALVLTIPLFNSGRTVTSNFEEYFQKKQIQYNKEQKILELENTLNNNVNKIMALKTMVASLTINVDQFNELYRLTEKSYSLGKSTLFELLDVQDNLIEAKINLASNKIQLYQMSETYNWQTGFIK